MVVLDRWELMEAMLNHYTRSVPLSYGACEGWPETASRDKGLVEEEGHEGRLGWADHSVQKVGANVTDGWTAILTVTVGRAEGK